MKKLNSVDLRTIFFTIFIMLYAEGGLSVEDKRVKNEPSNIGNQVNKEKKYSLHNNQISILFGKTMGSVVPIFGLFYDEYFAGKSDLGTAAFIRYLRTFEPSHIGLKVPFDRLQFGPGFFVSRGSIKVGIVDKYSSGILSLNYTANLTQVAATLAIENPERKWSVTPYLGLEFYEGTTQLAAPALLISDHKSGTEVIAGLLGNWMITRDIGLEASLGSILWRRGKPLVAMGGVGYAF